ncbi:phage holin family protein [Neisseriaceae bacterium B1]
MTALQYAAIQALAGAAALSILFFDKRGKRHKPLVATIAYIMFIQMGALVIAAAFKMDTLIMWLLILSLAVHTGNILIARGNVGKIQRSGSLKIHYRLPRASKPHIHLKTQGKTHEHI